MLSRAVQATHTQARAQAQAAAGGAAGGVAASGGDGAGEVAGEVLTVGMFASRIVAVLRASCVGDNDAVGDNGDNGVDGGGGPSSGGGGGVVDRARLEMAAEVTAGLLGTLPDQGLREEVRVAFATELESKWP